MTDRRPKTGRLVLVRHGQGSLGTDDYDRLSELGWLQSRSLGERLRDQYGHQALIESGTLRRHRQTVEAAVEPDQTVCERAELNEYAVDHLIQSALAIATELQLPIPDESAFAHPEAYLDTFIRWFPEVLKHWQAERLFCAHNGTWASFHQRVVSPLEAWQRAVKQGQTIVAITSAGVISTLCCQAIGESLDWQRQLNVSLYNASVSELTLDASGQWSINILNCLAHLSEPSHHTLA